MQARVTQLEAEAEASSRRKAQLEQAAATPAPTMRGDHFFSPFATNTSPGRGKRRYPRIKIRYGKTKCVKGENTLR